MEKKTCGIGKPHLHVGWSVLGCQDTHRRDRCGRQRRHVAHQNRQKKNGRERWVRDNLNLIVGVPWRKNDDDPKVDGEHLDGDGGDGQGLQRNLENKEYPGAKESVHHA